MKTIIMAIAILLAGTGSFAQAAKNARMHPPAAKAKYTCSMHPEVVRSKPGKCPKCGMALIKMKKPNPKTSKSMNGMKM
jgi:hypothetical protein